MWLVRRIRMKAYPWRARDRSDKRRARQIRTGMSGRRKNPLPGLFMCDNVLYSDFPELNREDIRACLAFAADRERKLFGAPA
jgi:hypothetical protein